MNPEVKKYLAEIGKKGGSKKTPKKSKSSAENGKKGGRPKGSKNKPKQEADMLSIQKKEQLRSEIKELASSGKLGECFTMADIDKYFDFPECYTRNNALILFSEWEMEYKNRKFIFYKPKNQEAQHGKRV